MSTITQYQYSSLLPGLNSTRLLRLLPHENENAPIECELINYILQDSTKGIHLYDALSYVWGGSGKPQSIFINRRELAITENLHAALLRLRDEHLPRFLWVDAICINQKDIEERGYQVRFMGQVYSKASCVIVWLGEAADDSDRALEAIRFAVEKSEGAVTLWNKGTQLAVLALLRRPWFRRIWILQEVAMARHVLIMCDSTEIDGYAFCLGLNSLNISYDDDPSLQSLILSVNYLIRGSISRSRRTMARALSRGIRPLNELVDMYHAHEATERHDKVYALLSMCSDDLTTSGLVPDYSVPWEHLFKQFIQYLFPREASVKVWDGTEMATITSKGCILGRVISIQSEATWGDAQIVGIAFENALMLPMDDIEWQRTRKTYRAQWSLQTSAVPIREGDLVCLLQGASKPTIIRLSNDYFIIIIAIANPGEVIKIRGDRVKPTTITWPEALRAMDTVTNDFLLVWDWERSTEPLINGAKYKDLTEEIRITPEQLHTCVENELGDLIRVDKMAQVLTDANKLKEAEVMFEKVARGYTKILGADHTNTLVCMRNLVLIWGLQGKWKKAEESLIQLIERRKRVPGVLYSDALESLTQLLSICRGFDIFIWKDRTWQMAKGILTKRDKGCEIIQDEIIKIVGRWNKGIITLLLGPERNGVQITEELLEAAAGNAYSGLKIISHLLQIRDDIQITEKIIFAAVTNQEQATEITAFLVKKGSAIQITRDFITKCVQYLKNNRVKISLYYLLYESLGILSDPRYGNVDFPEEAIKGLWDISRELGPKFEKAYFKMLPKRPLTMSLGSWFRQH